MNETKALAVVDEEFGSLEEFAYRLLTDPSMKRALDETESLSLRAEAVGLPVHVLARVLNSPAFKASLRTAIVNSSFGYFDEVAHIKHVVEVATNKERKVMSPKGEIGFVDQAPGDVIAAGKYLNELRGTSVEQKGGVGGGSINIQILNANGEAGPSVGVAVEHAPEVHTPQRAGALPPPGVLERGSRAVPRAAAASGADGLGLPAGPGERPAAAGAGAGLPGAAEAARQPAHRDDDSLAAETQRRALSRQASQVDERRRAWAELPDRKVPEPPAKPGRYGD